MRNPLNALLSSVEIQEKHIEDLKAIVRESGIQTEETERQFKSFCRSLGVSKSSCKMLKFNVEDILSLPQIQQGKFTKNVQLQNVVESFEEIKEIMNF